METTKSITIESTKGTVTVGSYREAAEWLIEYQPSSASVDGEIVDWDADDDVDAITRRIVAATAYATLE